MLGANLPAPMRWIERRTRTDGLHPLRPPSLLAVEPPEHTRYRKTVSSVFTPRAVAALRQRVEEKANALLDEMAGDTGVVDVVDRYCAQLPVAVISEILDPDRDRARVLEFGELAAPSLDFGLSWAQYRDVARGLAGFDDWLSEHLRRLRSTPGDDLSNTVFFFFFFVFFFFFFFFFCVCFVQLRIAELPSLTKISSTASLNS